jgi:SlyX protein
LICAADVEKQAFKARCAAPVTLGNGPRYCASIQGNLQFGLNCWRNAQSTRRPRQIGYTVDMTSDAIERIETKIAFLESANVELGDVVYRQQQQIAALRARLDALTQRLEAAQTADTPRSLEEERPPHY